MPKIEWLDVTVAEIKGETPLVRSLWLQRPHAAPLPAWTPGAHVKVRLPDRDVRSYSLVNLAPDRAATSQPSHYRLGVRQERASTGGSSYMHGLKVGDSVAVSLPSNDFELEPATGEIVLVAGGIGVTPIAGMAASLAAAAAAFRLHYASRTASDMAFRDELVALAGEHLLLHYDDQHGRFDLAGLMRGLSADQPLYLCGPRPMIDDAIALAAELGWTQGRLRFEIFSAAPRQAGDRAFDIVLQASGRTLTVPSDRTILDVMIEAGLDPLYDCKRGDCGICQAIVLEGEPDHRDYILSPAERASGKLMQICVSRAKSSRLVLDL